MLTQERLKELFKYNSDTGDLTRLISITGRYSRKGTVAGTLNRDGYIHIKINHKVYKSHRLIWFYIHGVWPDTIDHVNGDRSDNRIVNLRTLAFSENAKNKKVGVNNTSGCMGVHNQKQSGYKMKWWARIGVNGKRVSLGCYYDFFEACCARKSAENKYGYHPNHGRIQ